MMDELTKSYINLYINNLIPFKDIICRSNSLFRQNIQKDIISDMFFNIIDNNIPNEWKKDICEDVLNNIIDSKDNYYIEIIVKDAFKSL